MVARRRLIDADSVEILDLPAKFETDPCEA